MHFGKALHRLLDSVLSAETLLGLTYISKVNLADFYMHIYVIPEEIPSIDFIFLKETADEELLVGFQLSISMGYMDPGAFL